MKENLATVIVLTIDAMYLVGRCEFHFITMLLNLEYLHSIIMLILFELIGMLVHLEVKWFLHLVNYEDMQTSGLTSGSKRMQSKSSYLTRCKT